PPPPPPPGPSGRAPDWPAMPIAVTEEAPPPLDAVRPPPPAPPSPAADAPPAPPRPPSPANSVTPPSVMRLSPPGAPAAAEPEPPPPPAPITTFNPAPRASTGQRALITPPAPPPPPPWRLVPAGPASPAPPPPPPPTHTASTQRAHSGGDQTPLLVRVVVSRRVAPRANQARPVCRSAISTSRQAPPSGLTFS